MFKFCPHCGRKIHANAPFCPFCGTKQTAKRNQGAAQQPNFQQFNYQPGYQTNYSSNPAYWQKVQITPPPCSMMDAWRSFWHQYAKGHGYSSRSEYWFFTLDNFLIWIALIILWVITVAFQWTALFIIMCIGMVSFFLAEIIPGVSLTCRRLRDAGITEGWIVALVVLNFIFGGIVGIVIFIFSVMPSVRYQHFQ